MKINIMVISGLLAAGVTVGMTSVAFTATDDNPGNLRYTGSGPHYITNGKLGIGTTTPKERLHVVGGAIIGKGPRYNTTLTSSITATATVIPVQSTAGFPPTGTLSIEGLPGEIVTYTGIQGNSFVGVARGQMGTTPQAFPCCYGVGNILLTVETNDAEPRLVINNEGLVGIGGLPKAHLSIVNDRQGWTGTGMLLEDVNSGAQVGLDVINGQYLPDGQSTGRVIMYSNDPLSFHLGGQDRVRILPNGKIGVGTLRPTTLGPFPPTYVPPQLDVRGEADTMIQVASSMGSSVRLHAYQNGGAVIDASGPISGTARLGLSSNFSRGEDLVITPEGYVQLKKTSSGTPPATDCDDDTERGRLVIDTLNNRLYICNGASRGWDYIPLSN